MARKPYLVKATHTNDPKTIVVTISKSETDGLDGGLVDFFNFRLPESCFTDETDQRFSPLGKEILKRLDPEIMDSTRLYIPGTVRMSIHRAKDIPEMDEYREWLSGYLTGYEAS